MPKKMQTSCLLSNTNLELVENQIMPSNGKCNIQEEPVINSENNKGTNLSYDPPSKELPLFQFLFHSADKTENGSMVSISEALNILLLSGLSR